MWGANVSVSGTTPNFCKHTQQKVSSRLPILALNQPILLSLNTTAILCSNNSQWNRTSWEIIWYESRYFIIIIVNIYTFSSILIFTKSTRLGTTRGLLKITPFIWKCWNSKLTCLHTLTHFFFTQVFPISKYIVIQYKY